MIRTHLARGFLLVLLGGMAFTGLERAPIEEQPFVPLTVLLAAVVGGYAAICIGGALCFEL